MDELKEARFWTAGEGGSVRCGVCPHGCVVEEGRRGRCGVRGNVGGRMRSLVWGRAAAVAVDPVEKKPLYHFLPGGRVLSVGTLGCNLSCRFCQNDGLSRASAEEVEALAGERALEPEEVAAAARGRGVPMVAFTYNEPAVWAEWAAETAAACREVGVRSVAVTNGYVAGKAREAFFGAMDAANVDLKAFSEGFYRKQCGARLGPVLETLEWIRRESRCWLEVTTLVIPGLNDSDGELEALSGWVAEKLGAETPLHLSAFYGACEMAGAAPTPVGTLLRARRIAAGAGLKHVYLGTVRVEGGGIRGARGAGRCWWSGRGSGRGCGGGKGKGRRRGGARCAGGGAGGCGSENEKRKEKREK